MTRDEARAYFKEKGLTYDRVTLADLKYLHELLDEHFIRQRKERMKTHKRPLYWKRVNDAKYYKGEYNPETGGVICAYLTGNGEYFTAREVISFSRHGYICFCGEADEGNTEPVLTAFVEWCDWLSAKDRCSQK